MQIYTLRFHTSSPTSSRVPNHPMTRSGSGASGQRRASDARGVGSGGAPAGLPLSLRRGALARLGGVPASSRYGCPASVRPIPRDAHRVPPRLEREKPRLLAAPQDGGPAVPPAGRARRPAPPRLSVLAPLGPPRLACRFLSARAQPVHRGRRQRVAPPSVPRGARRLFCLKACLPGGGRLCPPRAGARLPLPVRRMSPRGSCSAGARPGERRARWQLAGGQAGC